MCALFSGLLQHCRGQRLLHRTFKERASEDPLERCSQEPAGCSGALRTSRGGQQWGREARGAGVTATRCMHADPPAVPPRVTVGTTEGTKAPAKQQEGRTLCPWDPRAAAVTGWTSFRGQRPSPPASRGGCDMWASAPRPVPGLCPQARPLSADRACVTAGQLHFRHFKAAALISWLTQVLSLSWLLPAFAFR